VRKVEDQLAWNCTRHRCHQSAGHDRTAGIVAAAGADTTVSLFSDRARRRA
jgi:hypothetical protein